jgi:hypothetical protein
VGELLRFTRARKSTLQRAPASCRSAKQRVAICPRPGDPPPPPCPPPHPSTPSQIGRIWAEIGDWKGHVNFWASNASLMQPVIPMFASLRLQMNKTPERILQIKEGEDPVSDLFKVSTICSARERKKEKRPITSVSVLAPPPHPSPAHPPPLPPLPTAAPHRALSLAHHEDALHDHPVHAEGGAPHRVQDSE